MDTTNARIATISRLSLGTAQVPRGSAAQSGSNASGNTWAVTYYVHSPTTATHAYKSCSRPVPNRDEVPVSVV